jgi:hypothetical protein
MVFNRHFEYIQKCCFIHKRRPSHPPSGAILNCLGNGFTSTSCQIDSNNLFAWGTSVKAHEPAEPL